MTLTYDFTDDGYEYEVDPTLKDYAAYLQQAYFNKASSLTEQALSDIIADFDCLSEELDNDDGFRDYMYNEYKDEAWDEYQDGKYIKAHGLDN